MPKVVLGQPIPFVHKTITEQIKNQMNMDSLTFNSSSDAISLILTSPEGSKEIVLDGAAYQAVAMQTITQVQQIRAVVIAQAVSSGLLPAGTIDNWSI
jgi:hypothetical protein